MSCELLQANEIEALSSIFNEEFMLENPSERAYSINITNSSGSSVYFKVVLPEDYPVNSPPTYFISAPWMDRNEKDDLCSKLNEVCIENIGESILYQWIVKIQDFIEGLKDRNSNLQNMKNCHSNFPVSIVSDSDKPDVVPQAVAEELPTVYHGEIITDRKSVFQGHAAAVLSVEQAKNVLIELKKNKKIATATHNIMAYRITHDTKYAIQDCDDDGESRGGSTLLHLLQILDLKNVVVIVSRWYGGIHLGPDRFKHISNAARMVLVSSGFIKEERTGTEKKHKKKS
ncbi:protein IMPACT [Nephila pilipes]|uniref:Protein IMPACT n=1 Tax=Nephila pilipes TaxID=299642 RepID=A0A8X6TBH4_NEPPI|nr:protein IMPACT [Nephila pilipes]